MKQQTARSVILTGEVDSILKLKRSTQLPHIDFHTLPTIQFEKCALSEGEQRILRRLHVYDYLFFSSVRAVQFFVDALEELHIDWKQRGVPPIVVVGPMTAKACERLGFVVVSQPSKFDTKHMVQEFSALKNSKILFPRSTIAPEDAVTSISNSGGNVTELPLYKTVYRTKTLSRKEEESLMHAYGVVFLSPSSIKSFVNLIKTGRCRHVLKTNMVLCIGPRTARIACEYHFKNVVTASEYTTQGVIDMLATLSE